MEDENQQEVLEAEKSMKKFLDEFQEFSKKHIITNKICYNLHSIFSSIEEFLSYPNLKYIDVKSKNDDDDSKMKLDDESFQKLFKIRLTQHQKALCTLCGQNVIKDPKEYSKHLVSRHNLQGSTDDVDKHIKQLTDLKYFCDWCKQDVGRKEKVQEHIDFTCKIPKEKKLIPMKESTTQKTNRGKSASNRPQQTSNSLPPAKLEPGIVIKNVKIAICKACKKQVINDKQYLLNHLLHFHNIPCILSRSMVNEFLNIHFDWIMKNIYFCEVCKLDIGNGNNIQGHVSSISHLNTLFSNIRAFY